MPALFRSRSRALNTAVADTFFQSAHQVVLSQANGVSAARCLLAKNALQPNFKIASTKRNWLQKLSGHNPARTTRKVLAQAAFLLWTDGHSPGDDALKRAMQYFRERLGKRIDGEFRMHLQVLAMAEHERNHAKALADRALAESILMPGVTPPFPEPASRALPGLLCPLPAPTVEEPRQIASPRLKRHPALGSPRPRVGGSGPLAFAAEPSATVQAAPPDLPPAEAIRLAAEQ